MPEIRSEKLVKEMIPGEAGEQTSNPPSPESDSLPRRPRLRTAVLAAIGIAIGGIVAEGTFADKGGPDLSHPNTAERMRERAVLRRIVMGIAESYRNVYPDQSTHANMTVIASNNAVYAAKAQLLGATDFDLDSFDSYPLSGDPKILLRLWELLTVGRKGLTDVEAIRDFCDSDVNFTFLAREFRLNGIDGRVARDIEWLLPLFSDDAPDEVLVLLDEYSDLGEEFDRTNWKDKEKLNEIGEKFKKIKEKFATHDFEFDYARLRAHQWLRRRHAENPDEFKKVRDAYAECGREVVAACRALKPRKQEEESQSDGDDAPADC